MSLNVSDIDEATFWSEFQEYLRQSSREREFPATFKVRKLHWREKLKAFAGF